jgi:hypothetical protein
LKISRQVSAISRQEKPLLLEGLVSAGSMTLRAEAGSCAAAPLRNDIALGESE